MPRSFQEVQRGADLAEMTAARPAFMPTLASGGSTDAGDGHLDAPGDGQWVAVVQ